MPTDELNDGKDKRFNCDKCDCNFSNKSSLEIHQYIHNIKTTHGCDKCKKRFAKISQLHKHKCEVYEATPPQQPVATPIVPTLNPVPSPAPIPTPPPGSQFWVPTPPKKPRVRDNKVRHFNCDECDSTFTNKSALEIHQYIHSMKLPHRCNVCKKRFAEATELEQHDCDVDSDKPHGCDVCQKRFTSKNGLRGHKKRIHDIPAKNKYKKRRSSDVDDHSESSSTTLQDEDEEEYA